ncbi:MAG: PLD nuclease N-terminal domain-containing protein [Dehalococcoidia bacterium]|nr:PLD nuclease N-terminal domain-containing protein [Dehalococcoidia bacterium]
MDIVDTLGMSIAAFLMLIIPIALLEMGLMIWALVDILRREYVRGNNKVIWILVVVFVGIIGPILYFILGRSERPEEKYEE